MQRKELESYLSVVSKTGDFRGLHWFTGVQITPNPMHNLTSLLKDHIWIGTD